MKITLKAHIAEHREIAKMFVGCKVGYYGSLVGVVDTEAGREFLLNKVEKYDKTFFSGPSKLNEASYLKEITLDTSSEMDLRLAIGTEIEFDYYGKLIGCEIPQDDLLYFHFEEETVYNNKSLFQLSKDYLDRIGVEAGE